MGTKSLLNRPISSKRKHNMKEIVDMYVPFAKKADRSMVKFRGNLIVTSYIKSKKNHSEFDRSMFYSSDISDVFLQSSSKF